MGFANQTYENIEIIVLDDGSTDGSFDIISNLVSSDSRIMAKSFKENRGFCKVFPEAMSIANGDFVMCGASDDFLIDRDFFKKCINAQELIPSAGCYGRTERVDSDTGAILGYIGCGITDGLINSKTFIKGFFERSCFVPGHSAMWRKSFVDVVGGYPMELGPQNDYYINHVLPCLGGVHFFDHNVAVARINNNSMSYGASIKDKIVRHATFQKMLIQRTGYDNEQLVADWREQLIYDLCNGQNIPENRNLYLQTLNN